jgi:hypothetical protein
MFTRGYPHWVEIIPSLPDLKNSHPVARPPGQDIHDPLCDVPPSGETIYRWYFWAKRSLGLMMFDVGQTYKPTQNDTTLKKNLVSSLVQMVQLLSNFPVLRTCARGENPGTFHKLIGGLHPRIQQSIGSTVLHIFQPPTQKKCGTATINT